MFLNVIVENKSNYIDSFFTYSDGGFSAGIGSKVTVPFGTGTKEGYVFSVSETCDIDESKVKDIISVDEEESLSKEMISTAVWMKQRYAIRYYDAIKLFKPPLPKRKRGVPKDPYGDIDTDYPKPERLTEEQEAAVEQIREALTGDKEEIFLIHGVTSSGKTEVYMEAIETCLSKGRGAVMLVPEISLTHQLIRRFIGRFGKDNIGAFGTCNGIFPDLCNGESPYIFRNFYNTMGCMRTIFDRNLFLIYYFIRPIISRMRIFICQ